MRQKLTAEGEVEGEGEGEGEVEDQGGLEEGTLAQAAAQSSREGYAFQRPSALPRSPMYQSPYAPMTLATTAPAPAAQPSQTTAAQPHDETAEEAALEASLQKINKQKRAIEQKLKALRERRAAPPPAPAPSQPSPSQPSPDPANATAKAAARQARMLSALQSRSRKRSNLTASWVEGREHWPIGPQTVLEDAMRRYSGYDDEALVNAVYGEVYSFVNTEGWERGVHDELLWERTRRKIATVKVHGFPSQVHQPKGRPEGERLLELVHGAGHAVADGGGQAQHHGPSLQRQSATGTSLEQELQHAMAGADGSVMTT